MVRKVHGRPGSDRKTFEPPDPEIHAQYCRRPLRMGARGGSQTVDKILRTAFGSALGFGLGSQIFLGQPETLEFSRTSLVNVPLLTHGLLGFMFGVLASPLTLLLTRGQPWPTYVLRLSAAFAFIAAAIAA